MEVWDGLIREGGISYGLLYGVLIDPPCNQFGGMMSQL